MKGIVLCFLMVCGLCWGNTTKGNELLKKHMFVYSKSFSFYDFQEIYGIENTEIVGKKPAEKKWKVKHDIPAKTGGDPVNQLFGKKPKPI